MKATTRAIVHDTWDKADLKRAGKEVRALSRARKKLNEFSWTGTEAIDDAFFALNKADPHLVDRSVMAVSHWVNHQVLTELLASPVLRRLREYTVGDLMQAALATVEVAKTLETIFDRLRLAQELADRLQETLKLLREAIERRDAGKDAMDALVDVNPDPAAWRDAAEDLRGLQRSVDLLQQLADGQQADLLADLAVEAPGVASTVSDGLQQAFGATAAFGESSRAWGVSPGDWRRMPADERMRLAKTLNTPRMTAVADLFGRIENLAFSAAAEQVDDLHDDVVDVEAGADLARVLSSEFLGLADPLTEADFLARLARDELLQVAVQGTDETGRGAIIMCIDVSGSMAHGERDLWAKAVMLVLLHQARMQGRQMHVIHFGYRRLVHQAFLSREDFTPERIIAAAETFWASGTDFEAPMGKAVELLRAEFSQSGRAKADVVFATDDECYVNPAFMTGYLSDMHDMNARTWGLMVEGDASPTGPLWQMSEGRVLTVTDLTSGRDLRPMLAGVR